MGKPESDVLVLGPNERKGNLVARLRGTGARRPLLLLAHLDVVEARKEDWSFDPFKFLEKDGYYYGRGTTDDKGMAAIWIANLAAGLARLSDFDFPVKLNEVTRAFFERMAGTQPGPVGDAMRAVLKSPRPAGAVETLTGSSRTSTTPGPTARTSASGSSSSTTAGSSCIAW